MYLLLGGVAVLWLLSAISRALPRLWPRINLWLAYGVLLPLVFVMGMIAALSIVAPHALGPVSLVPFYAVFGGLVTLFYLIPNLARRAWPRPNLFWLLCGFVIWAIVLPIGMVQASLLMAHFFRIPQ